jgi:four helix bundle protein
MAGRSYQDLIVWQKAMELVELAYELAGKLPAYERYALADQIRRSAVSIPSNIAEGQKRNGDLETRHFLSIALGSAAELETQIILANRLHGNETNHMLPTITEVSKILNALIRKLQPTA